MTPERFDKLKAVLRARQPDLTVLTDAVHKPHNVSAILRTCDAVGVRKLHAVSGDEELRRHHMVAGGSKRWVDIDTHTTIEAGIAALRDDQFRILVADSAAGAIDYREVDYTERVAIVLGAELEGPSAYSLEQADARIEIPMQGMVESLNVSVAAAVILFEAERQRRAAKLYSQCRIDAADYVTTLFEWAYPDIARRCREKGLAYPPLADDGQLLENPLRA